MKGVLFYLLNKANKQLKCCSKVQEGPQEAVEWDTIVNLADSQRSLV